MDLPSLPDELIVEICRRASAGGAPGGGRRALARALQGPALLRATCRRFGFLALERYLVHRWRGGQEVCTSVTLRGVPDGPEYWVLGNEFSGYVEYSNGVRVAGFYAALLLPSHAFCVIEGRLFEAWPEQGGCALKDMCARAYGTRLGARAGALFCELRARGGPAVSRAFPTADYCVPDRVLHRAAAARYQKRFGWPSARSPPEGHPLGPARHP